MAGSIWEALGAALQTGARTYGVLDADERQRKLQEQARQDQLQQQALVNTRTQKLDDIAMQDRQRRILEAAIANSAPDASVGQDTLAQVRQSAPELLGRLNITPRVDLNVQSGLPTAPAAGGGATYSESATRRATPEEQAQALKLKDAQFLAQGRSNFLNGKGVAGAPLEDTPENRLGVTSFFPGVNANEVFGPKKAGSGDPTAANNYITERKARTLEQAQELADRVSYATVGLGGSVLKWIPGTSANDFSGDIEALEANLAGTAITEMREASKTGGALGAVSDFEGRRLSSELAALRQGNSPEQFKRSLGNIVDSIQKWEEAKTKFGSATQDVTPQPQLRPTTAHTPQQAPAAQPTPGNAPQAAQRPPVRISELQARYGEKWMEAAAQFRAQGIRLIADVSMRLPTGR